MIASASVSETKRPTSAAAEEILGLYFPVLDHGFVSLNDYMGTDECIERAARVSYGYGTRKQSQTRGLLRYLRRHKHTTPSEMVELKFHCCMPIFIARQWIRHRTANVNEYSGRYSLIPMLFYTPEEAQLQTQSARNNQGRSGKSVTPAVHAEATRRWAESRRLTVDSYEWLTGQEVARELARIDLPLSTYTQWYWKIDLHNLLHFLTLRVDAHAQWEIQEFGRVMAGMLARVAPLSYEAWIDYDVCGTHLSRMELDVLRTLVTPHPATATATVTPTAAAAGTAVTGTAAPGAGIPAGLRATGGALDRAALLAHGLSSREADELLDKLGPKPVPSFTLDLAAARSAEFFAERFAAAVPRAELPDPG